MISSLARGIFREAARCASSAHHWLNSNYGTIVNNVNNMASFYYQFLVTAKKFSCERKRMLDNPF
jgi:hypothetical protein